MRIAFDTCYGMEREALNKELEARLGKIAALNPPFYLYYANRPARNNYCYIVLSSKIDDDMLKIFIYEMRQVDGRRWWIKIKAQNVSFNLNSFDNDFIVDTEFPVEIKGLQKSIIKKLFEDDGAQGNGFSAYMESK